MIFEIIFFIEKINSNFIKGFFKAFFYLCGIRTKNR